MKSNILTIMKKEFTRFFKDKRMVLTTIFLPGIMIYALYSFMGQGMNSMFESSEDYLPKVYVENLPESMSSIPDLPIELIETDEGDTIMQKIGDGEQGYDLYAFFPADFDDAVAAYDVRTQDKAPEVEIYYNSTAKDSTAANQSMTQLLSQYESSMTNKFDINSLGKKYDLASEKDTAGQVFSMMIPMLMMIFLFSGCMSVAPESIAGEKERGTIATLLVTPLKRSHLALGKILSLSVIAILSGLSSFLGTMLSLPKMMGDMEGMDAGVYQISDYLLLLAIILSTVLVIISLISIISAFAKNVKEASTWVMPLMIVVMLLGISSMIEGFKPTSTMMYLIPLYNSAQSMNGIFSFSYQMPEILATVASNVVFTAICAGILTKMFDSESVMFSK